MFTSLFNFSVFILRHFIKTRDMQRAIHLNITLCLLVNNSFKSIKSLFTFVVEHSLLVQPSERPVSFFVPSVTNQSLLRDFIGSFGTLIRSSGPHFQ